MLIVSGQHGRLGNQLWKQAHVAAFAMSSGRRLLNADFAPYAKHFPAVDGVTSKALRRLPGKLVSIVKKAARATRVMKIIEIGENKVFNLDEEIGLYDGMSAAILSGLYFIAPRSLEKYKKEVLSALAPHQNVLASSAALRNGRKLNSDILVGVHARQGDYRQFCEGRMFYEPTEYAAVMRNIVEQLRPRVVSFVVCSDEPVNKCDYRDLDVVPGPGDYIGDLYSLATCDYLLAAPSSYSMWASFYGGVPLHALNYKMEEYYGVPVPTRAPILQKDFSVASCLSFVPRGKLIDTGLA